MMHDCEASYHNFVVVNWLVGPTGRQARELLCNNCFKIVDLAKIREERAKYEELEPADRPLSRKEYETLKDALKSKD